ncbi:MAG: glycosyltransferase family 1 protein [Cyanobacteriota bacterium]|nr:glycosyltransferase family 1 protein [Cyanobacteriota bacterium]
MPKIAIDASHFNESASDGLNRYTREVLRGVDRHDGDFIVYSAADGMTANSPHLHRKIDSDRIYQNNFRGNLSRLLWHQTAFPKSLLQEKVSLAYSPVPEGMLFPVCPQVITVHDLLPIFFPETYPRVKYYFQYILPRLAKVSRAIIAVSEHTKRDLERFIKSDRIPIYVAYQGYRADIFQATPKLEDGTIAVKYGLKRFVLWVGEMRPYKNVRRLIQAFAQLKSLDLELDLELAIVGKLNKMDTTLTELPAQLGIAEKVKFLGYVADTDLAALYRRATAFVFPSLYEGFGIPPLEAMACGCPAIVSNAASLPEVCGEGAEYVDPLDIESIAGGIYRVATDGDLQNRLRHKGLNRVEWFQNREMFDRIGSILEECASTEPDSRASA